MLVMEMSNKKQQIPAIRFNGFTDAWEQRKLMETNTSFTDGNYGESYPSGNDMSDSRNGVPFLRGSNLKNGKLDNSGANYITLEKHKEFILDENDYIGIFKSTKFSIDEKMTIINELDLNILDNEEILKLVTNICLKSNIEISNNIFYKIFNNINSYDDSLKLLIKQIHLCNF